MHALANLVLAVGLLPAMLSGCTKPPPGILTLAPGMMTTEGATQSHPDGSLVLEGSAAGSTEIYLPRGKTSLAVSLSVGADAPAGLTIWFDGRRIATAPPKTETQVIREVLSLERGGVYALRLVAEGAPGTSVVVTKVVLAR